MASHQAGRGRDERAGAEDFDSGLDYGAFVEIEPGIEGLIHISEMSWTKKNVHPGKIVSTSQEVDVVVLDVDPAPEVVLAVKDAAAEAKAAGADAEVAPEPQGGDGGAEEFGGLGDGEQFGFAGGLVGHGWLRWVRVGCAP